jgi:hypothetical protein
MAHILSLDSVYSPSLDQRRGPMCHLRSAQWSVSVKNFSASGFYGSNVHWYWLATLHKPTVSDDSVECVLAALHAHAGFLWLPALFFQSCNPSFNLLCLHLTASEGTPASTSLSHGHNFTAKDPHHGQKNMKKRPIHFLDTETENRLMYVKYYTLWSQMSCKYICSYAVLI